MRYICLLLYYVFARHLPKSNVPIVGKCALYFRRWCCRHLFAECGADLNVEQGAYIGNGKSVYAGNHIGIGKNFCLHNRTLIIRDYLLMGENVLIQGGGALLRRSEQANRRWFQYLIRTARNRTGCLDWSKGNHFAWLQTHWYTFYNWCRGSCYARCTRLCYRGWKSRSNTKNEI